MQNRFKAGTILVAVLLTCVLADALAQDSKSDLVVGKSEYEFINYVLPYFENNKKYSVKKVIQYDLDIKSAATYYTIETKGWPFPMSIVVAKGIVWHYIMVADMLDSKLKDKFARRIPTSKTFERVYEGVYRNISTNELVTFLFFKRPDASTGYMMIMSSLPSSDPAHLSRLENNLVNDARKAGLQAEIIK